MIIFYVNEKLVDSVSSQEKKKSKLQQLLFIFALGVHFCLRQQQKSATASVYTLACYIMHKVLVDFRFSLNLSAPLSYLWVVKLLWYFGTSLLVTKCQNFSFQFNLTLSLEELVKLFKFFFSKNFFLFSLRIFFCGPFRFFRLHFRKARDKLKQNISLDTFHSISTMMFFAQHPAMKHSLSSATFSLTYKTSTPYYKFWMKNVKIVNGKWDRKRPHELSNPR